VVLSIFLCVCQIKPVCCSINGIADMAALPFMQAVVTCCVFACSLITLAAAQPCPKNQRLIRNYECDTMGPVACALNPSMWVKPNGGRPYCDWCFWGEYSDENNNNPSCTHCPVNTVVMQGRYNTKYNDLVGNWCEEDCGVALRNMIQYPVGNLGIGCNSFCSDMFDVFYVATLKGSDTYGMGIPCVNKGTTCTEADYKIADVMIVNYDESVTDIWPSRATAGKMRMNSDLIVSTTAKPARKCKLCPPGTYMRKRKQNAIFKRNNCEACPKGMISARVTEDAKLFIPVDVKKLTEQTIPDIIFPAADYVSFGCKACSIKDGVPQNYVCTQCQTNTVTKQFEQYQHAETVQIGSASLQFFLVVGTECRFCPPGYEYWNHKDKGDKTPCRSINGVQDCCRICLPNSYSAGNGARCLKVASNQGTETSFGALQPKSCAVGEELVYCSTSGLCLSATESRRIGWRTCSPCSLSDTKRADGAVGCKECADDKMDLADKSNQPATKCQQCSTCTQLFTTETTHVLHTIVDTNKRDSIIQRGTEGEQIALVDFQYTTAAISAMCKPLDRRSIKSDKFISADFYRPVLLKQDTAAVPDYHTLVRTSANCTLTRCVDVCRTTRFYYSPACGPQETDLTKIWVLHNSIVKQYTELSNTDKQQQLYVQHGPCQMCKPCARGMYNAKCNVYGTGVDPIGVCESCLTQCPAGFFMYHKDKEAGCHAPPEIFKYSNDLWKITDNYECQKCPTWVRDNDKIYVVTACGITEKYVGWSWDANSNLVKTEKDVIYSGEKNDVKELGQSFKNYRHFLRDMVAYCPVAYFYDERVSGCSFSQQQSSIYTIPGTTARTVSIGYSTYNPNCCKPCTTCSHSKKKDTSNWKACMGDSVENSQDFCVDRCGAMYWENETVGECRRCSTCDSGFLSVP